MVKNVLEAEKLLLEAFIVHENNETTVEKIAASYDKAIKAAPKGDSIYGRAMALKSAMYFLRYHSEKDEKIKAKLLTKAVEVAGKMPKNEGNLLGIYADAKIRLLQGKVTEAEIAPIITKVKETEATCWSGHMAKFFIIKREEGIAAKLEYLKKVEQKTEFKDDFRLHYIKSFAALDLEEYDLAIESFDKTIELEPRLLQSYFHKAECYGHKAALQQDREKQFPLLREEKAMLIQYREARVKAGLKDDIGVLSRLSNVHHQLGEYKEYFAESQKAVKAFPKETWPYVSLGMAYSYKEYKNDAERQKWLKESMKSFEKANKLEPASPHTIVCKAYAYEHFGMVEEALDCLKQAQMLMRRPEAKAELEEAPEIQGFMDWMLGEKLNQLREQKDLDTISIDSGIAGDEVLADLTEDYNKKATEANTKAHQLLEERSGDSAEQVSEVILNYNVRASLEKGRMKIDDVQKEVSKLRSDEAAYDYYHGFYQTLKGAHASASLAADGKFQIDVGNPVSAASSLLSLLPFGGQAAAAIVKGGADYMVKKKALDPMSKIFDICSDFEFGPMAAQLAVKVTYAKQQYLADQQPKVKTRFGKWVESFKKFCSDGIVDKFYDNPNKLAGHTDAVAILKEIYKGKKGALDSTPRADFEDRLEVFAMKSIGSEDAAREYDGTFETLASTMAGLALHFAE